MKPTPSYGDSFEKSMLRCFLSARLRSAGSRLRVRWFGF